MPRRPAGDIVPAGPLHAPLLAELHALAFPPAEAWSAAMFAGHLGQTGVFGLVHRAGGLVLARVAADEAEILTLCVAPEARRRGAGAALLAAAATRAAAAGAGRLFLEVAEANAAARALYAGAGFVEVGKRRGYYGPGRHALILGRNLRAVAV